MGSSLPVIFLIVFIYETFLYYKGFSDLIYIITYIPIALIILFCFFKVWGKYFFSLRVKRSKFSIRPKLLSFTKRFKLSKIKSIDILLPRARHIYKPDLLLGRSDDNYLYIYITITIKDVLERTHIFKLIRFYVFRTTKKTPFVEKKNEVTSKFSNALKDLKRLLPTLVSIRDEIKEEFET